ncbi:(R)-mandelonitrile lyase 1-like [Cucumis melo var. makuwa]|uniref:(R)-mandelonitrile lyase 1-like n=1 Tax=Cucumis melo var. makuwa TaxID=1194695 RepID=A0A5A7SN75_CUCMM|nr:(R)-mandelonitrile lyase 1-like [Cucumis melo var. makuwa]
MRSITWDDRPRCAILQRRLHSRNLELERYVQQNGKIPISITLGADKPIILPHVVWFSNTIDVLTRDTFSVPCLKLADVPLEYIEVIKSDLQVVDRVELFRKTHANRSDQFVSQATADAYVLNHSLEMRYARPFWVDDDRATQKVLVRAPSPSRERLVAILRLHMSKRCTPKTLAN